MLEAGPRGRPVVDVALAAVETVAVVYVMRGAFARHHLLAEARRHLASVLRGRPHSPGLDEQIVQTVVDDYSRPASRRMMTADLRALYPDDIEDQAVVRLLTRKRSASPYERVRIAGAALRVRVHAARRADRLGSRTMPHTVAVPTPRVLARGRPVRSGKADRSPEQATDLTVVDQTGAMFEAVAEMAAKLHKGVKDRAAPHRPGSQPTAPPDPTHTQQPAPPRPGGATPTGGVANEHTAT